MLVHLLQVTYGQGVYAHFWATTSQYPWLQSIASERFGGQTPLSEVRD